MFDPEHHGDGECLIAQLADELTLPEQEEIAVPESHWLCQSIISVFYACEYDLGFYFFARTPVLPMYNPYPKYRKSRKMLFGGTIISFTHFLTSELRKKSENNFPHAPR